jgi:polygalacturonase
MNHRPLTRREALRLGAKFAAGAALGSAFFPLRLSAQSNRKSVSEFDVLDFGAVGDGVALDTAAIQRAIDTAAAAGGGARVLLRGGRRYLIGALQLKGGIDFHLADDATLLVSTRREDYGSALATRPSALEQSSPGPSVPPVSSPQDAARPRSVEVAALTALAAHGLRITGTGTIDGRSREFMTGFDAENEWWRPGAFRPRLFVLTGCKDLELHDVLLRQAPSWTVHLMGCEHVLIDRVRIDNQLDVPNCDGIDPDHCRDVEIRGCHIVCGDDGIVVKTSRQGAAYGPCANIVVKDCEIETQDAGVKIGTETTQDIHDIRFEHCKIRSSCRGLGIQLRDEGNVFNIDFSDIEFVSRYHSGPWWGRGEAISLTAIPRTPQGKVGTIHDVRIRNVTGRAENSVRVNGTPESRLRDIRLENVAITLDRWTKYPGGVFDDRPTTAYPGLEPHGTPGFHVRYADNVVLDRCRIDWGQNRPDYFTHALEASDVTGLSYPGFVGEAAHPERDKAIAIR